MADKSFEEQVRDELQLFILAPEAEVWSGIASSLHKERKRRWAIWFIFLSGIAGVGSFFLFHGSDEKQNALYTNHSPLRKQPPVITGSEKALVDNSTGETVHQNTILIKQPVSKLQGKNEVSDKQLQNVFLEKQLVGKQNADQYKSNAGEAGLGVNMGSGHSSNREVNSDRVMSNAHKDDLPKNNESLPASVFTNSPTMTDSASEMVKNDSMGIPGNIVAADTTTPISGKVKQPWTFFLSGITGISGLTNTFLSNHNYNSNNAAYNSAPGGTVNNGVVHPVPDYTSAFSFGFGLEAAKPLSKKSSIVFGLGYQFYQSGVSVGNRVDSTRFISLVNGTNDQGFYYQDGGNNRYRNRYHFLDLSVSFYTQHKEGNRHPFRWKFGAGTSLLIANNALLYDPVSNILFSKNAVLHKAMLRTSFGFDKGIGTPSFLYIGPQIDYFMGSLSGINNTTPQHLFRASIKISVPVFKRKSNMQR